MEKPVGHLPTAWSVGNLGTGDVTEDTVSTSAGTLDIRSLELQKAILESEIDKTYFATRYNDIIKRQFGPEVNADADETPDHVSPSAISYYLGRSGPGWRTYSRR